MPAASLAPANLGGAEAALPAPQPRRFLLMIVVGLFVSTFVSDSRLAKLPLQFLLKNHLHLHPLQMAAFFGLTGLAWYFKPLAGLLSDVVPLRGTRRRHYLMLSGLGAGVLWAVLGLAPHRYGPLVITLIGANIFAVLASSVSGGLLVEAGQQRGWTGRMGALRETIIAGSVLLAQPVGGYLVGHAFGWTCGIGAVLFLGLVPAALFLLPEPVVPRPAGQFGKALKASLGATFDSRALWLAALFIFLKELSPGFGTPLFYYQTDTLHFSGPFLGWLGALFQAMAILGAALYAWTCTRLPLSRLLVIGIVLSAGSSLLFLGFHSHATAVVIQAASGLLGIFASVALMDLAVRATPRGGEAMAYSLLMSAFNLGLTASDLLGSWLYDKHHVALSALIWISAGTTLLCLFALPLISRAILERTDRKEADTP